MASPFDNPFGAIAGGAASGYGQARAMDFQRQQFMANLAARRMQYQMMLQGRLGAAEIGANTRQNIAGGWADAGGVFHPGVNDIRSNQVNGRNAYLGGSLAARVGGQYAAGNLTPGAMQMGEDAASGAGLPTSFATYQSGANPYGQTAPPPGNQNPAAPAPPMSLPTAAVNGNPAATAPSLMNGPVSTSATGGQTPTGSGAGMAAGSAAPGMIQKSETFVIHPPLPDYLSPKAKSDIAYKNAGTQLILNGRLPDTQARTNLLDVQGDTLRAKLPYVGDQSYQADLLAQTKAKDQPGLDRALIGYRGAAAGALGTNAGANALRAKVYGTVAPVQAKAAMTNAQAHAATVPILQQNANTNAGRLGVAQGQLGVAQRGLALRQQAAGGGTPTQIIAQQQKIIHDNNATKVGLIARTTFTDTTGKVHQRAPTPAEQDLINRANTNILNAQGNLARLSPVRPTPGAGGAQTPKPLPKKAGKLDLSKFMP